MPLVSRNRIQRAVNELLSLRYRKRFRSLYPVVRSAHGFRIVSYSVVVLAAVTPAVMWTSLTGPANSVETAGLPFHAPVVIVGGIILLEAALILWVKMLQFGNERVRRRHGTDDSPNENEQGLHTVDSLNPSRPGFVDKLEYIDELPASVRRPRVLVVDDDPINRMILRKQLLRLDVDSQSAADGIEALETVRDGCWDLVLMDGQMPRMDGPEAAMEIRSRKLLPADTPIVAITTNDSPGYRELCFRSGMDACYHKPVRLFVLEKLIDMYVRKQTAEDPLPLAERTIRSLPEHAGLQATATATATSSLTGTSSTGTSSTGSPASAETQDSSSPQLRP